ncbi:TRAP transporter permease [Pseudoxanthomonas sp. JBR18]|uniref:TRAP transporter permease n=1 Tax=Pseudoxanthomonas sp. JBR18 TaxID=2969308 RepID=UPI002306234C|nr:TRAP transporter permease [Pseudoxanthomonas sp. JBR18]WCE06144.1 TRAP transporter permease [Pseudoxanthomonas sp. JBR18]
MSNQPLLARTEPTDWPRILFFIALAFSVFQIATAGFHLVSSQVLRAMHVGFALLLTFLIFPLRGDGKPNPVLAWVLGALAMAGAAYQWIFEGDLIQRSGTLTPADMVIGVVTIVLVFEAARRVMGWGLPIICLLFLLYAMFGEYIPGAMGHRPFGFDQIVNQLSFGTEGLYGTPTYVSATYIFLFVLFGAFLEQSGMIQLFTDFAMGLFGHRRGGPAKVAVASSAFMGTISGSGVANVVTTGQFTIPLMKRFGYGSAFAGGVEAASSMGSQLMPPVMGAVAFIMAETINVAYVEIVKAAIIPAALYFAAIYWMVQLEANRSDLRGLPKDQCPNPWAAIRLRWYLLIPLAVLVGLLMTGRTPMLAGTIGLALTVLVILGSAIALNLKGMPLRVAFWIALGLIAALALKLGNGPIFIVLAVLAVACFMLKTHGRETLRLSVLALANGARQALPVAVACILVGVIIGVVSLTGIASTFAGFVIDVGRNSLLLSLVLTMVTCLVLGMGIPSIPNYIITSSIAAPALLALGVPLLVSHMFVFYFGILADLTPPVALACFAAAPIARESGLKISFWAIRIVLAGFVLPFMAVYTPALMLQGGTVIGTVYVIFKAVVAIGLWGIAGIGYWRVASPLWERLLMAAAGALLVTALPITDELGFAVAVAAVAIHLVRARRAHAATAAPVA